MTDYVPALGDLVFCDRDRRRPVAWTLYCVIGLPGDAVGRQAKRQDRGDDRPHTIQVLSRGLIAGAASPLWKPTRVAASELIPFDVFGVRVRRIDREARRVDLEPIPGADTGLFWPDGRPRHWASVHSPAQWQPGDFTVTADHDVGAHLIDLIDRRYGEEARRAA